MQPERALSLWFRFVWLYVRLVMKHKFLFDVWKVTFNRTGLQSVRSSDHWVNGVNEGELLGMISLRREGIFPCLRCAVFLEGSQPEMARLHRMLRWHVNWNDCTPLPVEAVVPISWNYRCALVWAIQVWEPRLAAPKPGAPSAFSSACILKESTACRYSERDSKNTQREMKILKACQV